MTPRSGTDYAAGAGITLRDPHRPYLLVALHGLTATRAQPLALLDGLDDARFGVLAPDLRAHGDTRLVGPPEAFTPATLAADVAGLVDRLGLRGRRCCLLGISLGATVALELLRSGALEVAGAVFVRPAHHELPAAHLRANVVAARLLRTDPSSAPARLLETAEYRAVAAASPSGGASLRAKVAARGAAERVMRLEEGSRWIAFEAGERVAPGVPTLVIGMPADPLHPVAVAESWSRRITGSTLVLVPSRDQDPDGSMAATRAAIAAFVRTLDRAGPVTPGAAR